jgi:hypothetical protein
MTTNLDPVVTVEIPAELAKRLTAAARKMGFTSLDDAASIIASIGLHKLMEGPPPAPANVVPFR